MGSHLSSQSALFFLGLGIRYSFWCPSDMFCAGHVVGERTAGVNGNHSVVFCFLYRRCLSLMEESCNGFVCGVFEGIGL